MRVAVPANTAVANLLEGFWFDTQNREHMRNKAGRAACLIGDDMPIEEVRSDRETIAGRRPTA